MNLQQLKNIIEIARVGSITKAAENLYMNQPNLSRSVIDFENEYGITLFNRTPQGVELTDVGKNVVKEAEKIINQTNEFSHFLSTSNTNKLNFKVSVPRASYISQAFCKSIVDVDSNEPLDICFKESNNTEIIHDIALNGYNLGVIRVPIETEDKFKKLLTRKKIDFEEIWKFKFNIVFSKNHPLAKKETIFLKDLGEYSVLRHDDEYVPFIPKKEINKHSLSFKSESKIVIQERGSQFDILSNLNNTYMWVSPIPKSTLERQKLIMRKCSDNDQIFVDMLIFPSNYVRSDFENKFVSNLKNTISKLGDNR